ncbi:thiosulfate/3-mercaptopyruvate sulfurtransferase, partial [Tremellales sp. Uapishka_1]
MPNSTRSSVAEYLAGPRLPGARRFDLDEVSELSMEKNPLGLGHMLPSKEKFQKECRKLNISNDDHVVLYDTVGVFSSPRGAWTFKAFGHDKVSVLDGGLPRWIQEEGEIERGEVGDVGESEYIVGNSDDKVVESYEEVVANSDKDPKDPSARIVFDARPRARFTGEAAEPRPGLSSGHMPHSLSLPFTELLEPATAENPYTTYKTADKVEDVLKSRLGDEWDRVAKGEKKVVYSCGSGMTAGVLWLGGEMVKEAKGVEIKSSVYDESWTGYAQRAESKIVKGE